MARLPPGAIEPPFPCSRAGRRDGGDSTPRSSSRGRVRAADQANSNNQSSRW